MKYFSSGFVACLGLTLSYKLSVQIILSSNFYATTLISNMVFNLSGGTFTSMAELEGIEGDINYEKIFKFLAGVSAFAKTFLTVALVE